MSDLLLQAFSMILQPGSLLAMLLGLVIGLVLGVIPGIGGPFALALLMPLTFGMNPVFGVVLLVTLISVVGNGGSVSAILMGIPGTPTNAATIFDGYQMCKEGKAGRALGASLTASGIGGIFGALVLVLIMPVMRPVILAFGHPELFMLALFGISFVAILNEGSMLKAFLAGIMGVILALVGYDPVTGVSRFDAGLLYLSDGIKLIPVTLGLFAIPEILELFAKRGEEKKIANLGGDIFEGIKDVFRHWFLVVRCSVLGVLIGMIPGLGGDTATFLAYGHAKQSSRYPERFGHGEVAGVIAPETANNAKEGGALVPTLGFGIPGSTVMAIMVSAFIILGYQPGPAMLKNQPEIIMVMALLTALTNVVGSAVCLLAAKGLIKLASLRAELLVPWILMFVMVGAYVPEKSYGDVLVTICFGILGFYMQAYGYPRVVLLLALVLTQNMELNYWMALQYFGMAMFFRPIVLILLTLIILTLSYSIISERRGRSKTA